jgi:predicted Zn-dependent protease
MPFSFHRTTNFDEREIPAEMIRFLVDMGYLATGSGRKQDAENIFEAVLAARPGDVLPLVACSFMRIVFGEYVEASHLLIDRALKIDPTHEMAQVFYGLLLYQVGRKGESSLILKRIIDNGKDQDAITLAESIMGEGK